MDNEKGERAYLLHQRKYTDSRIIVDVFSRESGVVSGVFRLPSKKNAVKNLPAFCPLFVECFGSGELKTFSHVEALENVATLVGDRLFAGIYLNEILLRLLPRAEANEDVFELYETALAELALLGVKSLERNPASSELATTSVFGLEPILRKFELGLLEALGYGVSFEYDTEGQLILNNSDSWYCLQSDGGFSPIANARANAFSGAHIRQIGQLAFFDKQVQITAKRICRVLLAHRLGPKPLKSRELFRRG